MKNIEICVIGLGYIGLPTAALLASNGYKVIGVDVNQLIVDVVNQGKIHIVEPELDAYVKSAVSSGNLKAKLSPQVADIFIICVPTPFIEGSETPLPNIDYVLAAADSIKSFVEPGNLVILESTSPIGTTKKIEQVFQRSGVNTDEINIAYCPERVLPGNIMRELVENDRVVGGLSFAATQIVSDFYRTFVRGRVLETNASTAEMCKLVENSYRDVNIAFANELSILSANEGIDVWKLIELANHHPRVNILQPGVGVGGHCIAVDPWFLVAQDPMNANLIRVAREVNNFKTKWVIDKIKKCIDREQIKSDTKIKVACLGITFKPDIDDLRESPALQITQSLLNQGYDVIVVEPNIKKHKSLKLVEINKAIAEANVIAVLVRHKEFLEVDALKNDYANNVMDFCGIT
ncbi:UDP-N-acetyl-D-mannosamine dehydrogenase [Polynucleobacter sp. AP-Ainpum-60-G11]|uniref:UDP-N-acetyl-D-mannosamine dehydrogenase n=1 Tax=Polynucleobacter sp. AP-Ainpum-60-G11 TaxID=2576926 RepID=UPI001BFDD1C1|nr:UDP-N-acetyl-D-mannosamine dehydrogenase [Polynucleobacter sp. AP-Ainpum-60-G11]QWE27030.1 UDP-N-acetyl-D-mannosamine dehydrogenase [Polynucleobacter sp. AP-Ainpum-60-G11]